MATAIRTCADRRPDPFEPRRAALEELSEVARQSWTLRVDRYPVLVRPARPRDLAAVARMHRRCSARSLLDRYRCGGRAPSAVALDRELRNPLGYVATMPDGSVMATASIQRDRNHHYLCAEVQLLVEDRWQRHGIGGDLMSHLAGVAQVAGFTELIAYPATAMDAAQRLMIGVGRTRLVPDEDVHLHTYLPESATLGLGSVRERLAG